MAQSRARPGNASRLRPKYLTDLGWHDSRAFTVRTASRQQAVNRRTVPDCRGQRVETLSPLTHELARLNGQHGR